MLTEPRFAETPLLPGMILMLGLAALSAAIGLAAIIGAFLAGMVVGESSERDALEKETAPIAALFTPFFFGFIGAQIDPTVFGTPSTVALLLGITALAIVTKFAGSFLGALRVGRDRALLIGWAMVPRGEVEIIVAGLALAAGAFGPDLYLVVVGMVVITSMLVPPLPAAPRPSRGTGDRAGRGGRRGRGTGRVAGGPSRTRGLHHSQRVGGGPPAVGYLRRG